MHGDSYLVGITASTASHQSEKTRRCLLRGGSNTQHISALNNGLVYSLGGIQILCAFLEVYIVLYCEKQLILFCAFFRILYYFPSDNGWDWRSLLALDDQYNSQWSEQTKKHWKMELSIKQKVREARGTERRLRGESSRMEDLTLDEERMLAKYLRELAMKVRVS